MDKTINNILKEMNEDKGLFLLDSELWQKAKIRAVLILIQN